jgi:hypothetical protein
MQDRAKDGPNMRKSMVIILVFLAVAWIGLSNIGSSLALADIASRPILALTKDGQRVPVQQAGQAPAPDMALIGGAAGVSFGTRFRYTLPGGETVLCTIRFKSLTCGNGWTAERNL